MTGLELAMVGARLLQFGSAMILLGAPVLYLAALPDLGEPAARDRFDRWLQRILLPVAATALLSAMLWLDLEAGSMGGGWDQALVPATIEAVLFETTFGAAWQWHLGFAALTLLAVLIPLGSMRFRAASVALFAGGEVVSLAWAGHAVMHPGPLPVLNQAVHLLATAIWLGSLPVLGFIAGQTRDSGNSSWAKLLQRVLPRYSRAGIVAVAVILVTGCVNSWLLVARPSLLLETSFGNVLLVKITLFLLMVWVAIRNRLRLTPSIVAGGGCTSVGALWRSVAVEQLLGLGVILAVSVLGMLPPAMAM